MTPVYYRVFQVLLYCVFPSPTTPVAGEDREPTTRPVTGGGTPASPGGEVAPTSSPAGNKCVATGAWRGQLGTDNWCRRSCNRPVPHCPAHICSCSSVPGGGPSTSPGAGAVTTSRPVTNYSPPAGPTIRPAPNTICVSVGMPESSIPGMDEWCQNNCHNERPFCPARICQCYVKH